MRTLQLIVILFIAVASQCNATAIAFVQGGWSEAGPLRVAFSGEDANFDGLLELGELDSFNASYVTPSGPETAWVLSDLVSDGFLFEDLGNYLFFATNPEYSVVATAFEGEALSSIFDANLFPVDSSADPASAVPEPSGSAAVGLAALSLSLAIKSKLQKRKERK